MLCYDWLIRITQAAKGFIIISLLVFKDSIHWCRPTDNLQWTCLSVHFMLAGASWTVSTAATPIGKSRK